MLVGRRSPTGLLPICAAIAAACAGTPRAADPSACALAPADSVYLAAGPVYRSCAVDRVARPRGRRAPIDFQPSGPMPASGCFSAEVEFVVGSSGVTEAHTARLVRSNNLRFGEAVLASVPHWRYDPARKDGAPVRQILRETHSVAYRVTALGSGPAPRAPRC